MELPNKKYKIIYADPPWKYDFSNTNNRKIENKYPTMTQKELCNLKVPSDDNCILYLWATAPKLLEAIEVMKAWGFTYKTHAIWDKKIIGMGYWWRGQHELLLVGVKGKMSPPQQEFRKSSVYSEQRGKHSEKPDEFRQNIIKSYPTLLKIELFARERHEGWDAWGNEVPDETQTLIKSNPPAKPTK